MCRTNFKLSIVNKITKLIITWASVSVWKTRKVKFKILSKSEKKIQFKAGYIYIAGADTIQNNNTHVHPFVTVQD